MIYPFYITYYYIVYFKPIKYHEFPKKNQLKVGKFEQNFSIFIKNFIYEDKIVMT